jgi:hypothetical protein
VLAELGVTRGRSRPSIVIGESVAHALVHPVDATWIRAMWISSRNTAPPPRGQSGRPALHRRPAETEWVGSNAAWPGANWIITESDSRVPQK